MRKFLTLFFMTLLITQPTLAESQALAWDNGTYDAATMEQFRCLALCVYFESRGENSRGMASVATVVLRRVKNPRWPNTICEVVWKKRWVSTKKKFVAHFSWTNDGKSDKPTDEKAWLKAQYIAISAYENRLINFVGEATHYHSTQVSPWWQHSYKKVATIGNHIFYK